MHVIDEVKLHYLSITDCNTSQKRKKRPIVISLLCTMLLWRTSWSHDHDFWSHDRHLTCSANQKSPRVSRLPRGLGYFLSLVFRTLARQDVRTSYSTVILLHSILFYHHNITNQPLLQPCQARKYYTIIYLLAGKYAVILT